MIETVKNSSARPQSLLFIALIIVILGAFLAGFTRRNDNIVTVMPTTAEIVSRGIRKDSRMTYCQHARQRAGNAVGDILKTRRNRRGRTAKSPVQVRVSQPPRSPAPGKSVNTQPRCESRAPTSAIRAVGQPQEQQPCRLNQQ